LYNITVVTEVNEAEPSSTENVRGVFEVVGEHWDDETVTLKSVGCHEPSMSETENASALAATAAPAAVNVV